MNFTLIPFEGTDSIKLGMTDKMIKEILKTTPDRLKKTRSRENEMDQFDVAQVEYNDNNECIYFQFYAPAKVYFHGIQLIGANYYEIEKLFKTLDDDLLYEDEIGFYSLKYQMSIYAPDEPEGRVVETVVVAKESYYDSLLTLDSIHK